MSLVTDRMDIIEHLQSMGDTFKTRVKIENSIAAEFNRALDRIENKELDGTIVMKFVWFDCHQFVRDNPELAKQIDFDLEEFIQILLEEYEEFGVVESYEEHGLFGEAAAAEGLRPISEEAV